MSSQPRPAQGTPSARRAAFNSHLTSSDAAPTTSVNVGKRKLKHTSVLERSSHAPAPPPTAPSVSKLTHTSPENDLTPTDPADGKGKGKEGDDGTICFICAEEVTYWAMGECGHRTCHTCSIRLRALYQNRHCTFCKTECPRVIFTSSPTAPFNSYPPSSTPFSDIKLGILFETREQMDDSLSLLSFNCPHTSCDRILNGWADLKRHVRTEHKLALCELCTHHKKIFSHEHELYGPKELQAHTAKEHHTCGFDRTTFYDSEGLYAHCRDRHEECFICVRQGIRHQYHLNYDKLEEHYKAEHFLCPHPTCLAQKFVVFESEIDLQAHAVDAHGAALTGDQKARRDARRIETNFTYEGEGRGRGGTSGGRAGRTAGGPHGLSRQERFGATLTSAATHDLPPHQQPSRPLTPVTPVSMSANGDTVEKHAALLRQVAEAAGSEAKVTSFKLAVRSYRASEMSASDLVDSLWNVLDQDEETVSPVVIGLSELLEDPDKKRSLLAAWQDFRAGQNSFPSLAPIGPTLNGIPTAPHNTSHRALNTRNVRNQRDPTVWARVETAASRATPTARERFPALPIAAAVAAKRSAGVRPTPWAGTPSATASGTSSTALSRASTPLPSGDQASFVTSTNAPASAPRPPRTGAADFPSLPSSQPEAERRERIRAALGRPAPTILDVQVESSNAWGGGTSGTSTRSASPEPGSSVASLATGGKAKKQKKQKILLMSHGIQRG